METCDLQLQLFWSQSRKGRELKWYCCDQSPGSSSLRQYLDSSSLQQRQYKKFPFCSSSLTAIFCTQLCKHLFEKCSKPDQSNDCVFKNKNNFTKGQQLPLIYLDPIGQMVWIMGNRQLHLWDQLQAVCGKLCIIRENQHGTMQPEKPLYDCCLGPRDLVSGELINLSSLPPCSDAITSCWMMPQWYKSRCQHYADRLEKPLVHLQESLLSFLTSRNYCSKAFSMM